MRIPPATCKYTQLSRHVRIHDSGRGRGNLIRVFTPSKACLSPSNRGAHKSSSSVSPCVASDVHAPPRTCMLSYDVVFTCRFAYPTRQASGKNRIAELSVFMHLLRIDLPLRIARRRSLARFQAYRCRAQIRLFEHLQCQREEDPCPTRPIGL